MESMCCTCCFLWNKFLLLSYALLDILAISNYLCLFFQHDSATGMKPAVTSYLKAIIT